MISRPGAILRICRDGFRVTFFRQNHYHETKPKEQPRTPSTNILGFWNGSALFSPFFCNRHNNERLAQTPPTGAQSRTGFHALRLRSLLTLIADSGVRSLLLVFVAPGPSTLRHLFTPLSLSFPMFPRRSLNLFARFRWFRCGSPRGSRTPAAALKSSGRGSVRNAFLHRQRKPDVDLGRILDSPPPGFARP